MALGTRSNSNTTYLQVDYGKKSLYIYSSTPKQGFEHHVSSTGNESYRMYVNYVSGNITNAYFRDGKFGQEFVLEFTDGDESYKLPMGTDGSLFTAIAKDLENVDTSKVVQLSVYGRKSEKNGKVYLNVSFKYPNDKDEEGKAKLVSWGSDYPKPKKRPGNKYDFTEIEDEAYLRAENFITSNDFSSESTPSSDGTAPEVELEDELDDLPF